MDYSGKEDLDLTISDCRFYFCKTIMPPTVLTQFLKFILRTPAAS